MLNCLLNENSSDGSANLQARSALHRKKIFREIITYFQCFLENLVSIVSEAGTDNVKTIKHQTKKREKIQNKSLPELKVR